LQWAEPVIVVIDSAVSAPFPPCRFLGLVVDGSDVEHIPVLVEKLAEQVNLPPEGVMVDATIGHGGHSLRFGQMLGPAGVIVGFDVDERCLRRARSNLSTLCCKLILIHANFSEMVGRLKQQGIDRVDFILADLGVCSSQLADSQMGLSFQSDMPLDMRFDKRLTRTAADIVNESDEKSLADLIYRYGEDRGSRRIARFIVGERQKRPITTTGRLAGIVIRALAKGPARTRLHPATRTFQALRIAVNNELENLAALLESAPKLLSKEGRIAVISYHSLEDRLVKNQFKENEKKGYYRILTKKPITPSREEVRFNRRARSAKLRIAERI